jgi:lysophospholipase L1-like esterase
LRARTVLLLRLGLVLISVLVALGSVEALVRVRQWLQTGTSAAAPYSLALDPGSGLWIPTPGQVSGPIRINRDGFRGPDVPRVKPPGTIRLAFLGGSTTFCAEVSGNDATWPDQLTRALRARHPGVSFDYLNAGVPGYGMGSIRATLERRVAPYHPDVIVLYEATNDMAADTRAVAARHGLFHDLTADPSPLAKVSVTWYLIERRMIARRRQAAVASGIVLPYNADSLARVFEERVVGVLRDARAVAPLRVVATFSHKMRRGQPPAVALANATYSMYYSLYQSVDGLIRMYDAYNEALRRAARATDAILVDGEDDIPADDLHFTDSVHFTDEGARAMAARVLRGLEESPDFRALVATNGQTPRPRP